MAPRKDLKISATTIKKGTSKQPKKPKKAVSSPPTGIKCSIPFKTNNLVVPDNEKRVDICTKIALADEVARSQLLTVPVEARFDPNPTKKRVIKPKNAKKDIPEKKKSRNKKESPPIQATKSSTPPPVKTRGKKRKKDSVDNATCDIETKPKTKVPKMSSVPQKILTRNRIPNSTKQNTSTSNTDNNMIQITKEENTVLTPPIEKKRNILSLKGKRRTDTKILSPILQSSKLKVDKTATRNSSSSDFEEPQPKTPSSTPKFNKPGLVNSRKTSCSSVSNLSWTKDISSSSTTTCVTVSSTDYVRFNKKLPIIQLANIDSKIDKYRAANTENATRDVCPPVADKNVVIQDNCVTNDLKLSSTDSDSTETYSNIADDQIKHIERTADTLTQIYKRLDMDFINWIHGPSYERNIEISKNFIHILNIEFSTLKHCRKLQTMLSNDGVNISDDDSRTTDIYNDDKIVESPKFNNNNIDLNKVEAKRDVINKVDNNETKNNSNTVESKSNKTVYNKKIDTDEFVENKTEFKTPEKTNEKENELEPIHMKPLESNVNFKYPTVINNVGGKLFDEITKPSTSGVNTSINNTGIDMCNGDDSGSDMIFTKDVLVDNFIPRSPPDDDDALSLFAESITGIESSRVNTSIISAPIEKSNNEYIPEPLRNTYISNNYTYNPTKIGERSNSVVKTVCEKQNADSTSIYKEINASNMYAEGTSNSSNQEINNIDTNLDFTKSNRRLESDKPRLLSTYYSIAPRQTNIIFKGYCFSNLLNRCNYPITCRFSHKIPKEIDIKNQLGSLNEYCFLKEYVNIRRWKAIVRLYGEFFINECAKRKLTRVLVEMSYDFVYRATEKCARDDKLKMLAVETALLHLNDVDLSECEDLLKLKINSDTMLCEVYMAMMASNQNFTRFKSVFLNLTYFMVINDRLFTLTVAEQLLERVCILPFDESIIKALIQIMRLTDLKIYLHPILPKFEELIRKNSDIWEDYFTMKKAVNFERLARDVVVPPMASTELTPKSIMNPESILLLKNPQPSSMEQPMVIRPFMKGVPHPPSPDTTHLDNMNKTSEVTMPETRRTRNNIPVASSSSSNSEGFEYRNWEHRSIYYDNIRPRFLKLQSMRGQRHRPMRARPLQGRLVTLRNPNNYVSPRSKFYET